MEVRKELLLHLVEALNAQSQRLAVAVLHRILNGKLPHKLVPVVVPVLEVFALHLILAGDNVDQAEVVAHDDLNVLLAGVLLEHEEGLSLVEKEDVRDVFIFLVNEFITSEQLRPEQWNQPND